MRPKPVGTLVHDALMPGKRLFLFSTGTGIAPFASIIRDPETYDKFEQVILTHTCRDVAELDYGHDLVARIRGDEMLVGDGRRQARAHRHHHPRGEPAHGPDDRLDPRRPAGRGETGAPLDPATDRVMICGSMAMLQEHKAICEELGFDRGLELRARPVRHREGLRRLSSTADAPARARGARRRRLLGADRHPRAGADRRSSGRSPSTAGGRSSRR